MAKSVLIRFSMDVTSNASGQRTKDKEVVYSIVAGKIIVETLLVSTLAGGLMAGRAVRPAETARWRRRNE